MNPEPIDFQWKSSMLEEHRTLLKEIGEIISGKRCIVSDESFHYFYRVASQWSGFLYKPMAQTDKGTVTRQEDGTIVAKDRPVFALCDHTEEALEFLMGVIHVVTTRRREVAMDANRDMPANNRYPQPGGQRGHLLKEYDLLLEQLQTEYRHQRRRVDRL